MDLNKMMERRRQNLLKIIKDRYNNVVGDFARAAGMCSNAVTHLKVGRQKMTEKTTRKIEEKIGLPYGAMDFANMQMTDIKTIQKNLSILTFLSIMNWIKRKKIEGMNDDMLKGVYSQAYDILKETSDGIAEITKEMLDSADSELNNKLG